jgi:hypothetical protein
VHNRTPDPQSGSGPGSFVPKPRFEYKAPSLLWEHRYLAIFFAAAIVAASVYLFSAPHRPLKIEPPASPVYVEPIPERPASGAR